MIASFQWAVTVLIQEQNLKKVENSITRICNVDTECSWERSITALNKGKCNSSNVLTSRPNSSSFMKTFHNRYYSHIILLFMCKGLVCILCSTVHTIHDFQRLWPASTDANQQPWSCNSSFQFPVAERMAYLYTACCQMYNNSYKSIWSSACTTQWV
jgi:hypothetical protein